MTTKWTDDTDGRLKARSLRPVQVIEDPVENEIETHYLIRRGVKVKTRDSTPVDGRRWRTVKTLEPVDCTVVLKNNKSTYIFWYKRLHVRVRKKYVFVVQA